jgi:hypothetical protein
MNNEQLSMNNEQLTINDDLYISKYEKMIFNVVMIIMSILLSATGYSRKGKQKEKQLAANMSVMTLGQVNLYRPYTPDLASIRQHECPGWFRDAKFGMFIEWGFYSVAGWDNPRKDGGNISRLMYERHAIPQQGETYFINTQLKFRLYEEIK